MKKAILWLLLLFIWIWFTFAHQPRLIFQQPAGQVVNVQNPEISQAFYGNLAGQEDTYQIVSITGFLLYVNILSPDLSGSRTDFIVDIIEGNAAIYTRIDGKKFQRSKFFEPFGGDTYLQWISREKQVGPGTYTIKVSNSDNQGKYSLAIGKLESFSMKEIINTYKVMPALKIQFFEKPRYTIFWNYVWLFLLVMIVAVVVVVWWGVKIVKYIRRR